MDKYTFKVLENNLKFLSIPSKKTKIVYLQLSFNVGSDLETLNPNTLEITHFLEHMYGAFTSKKYPESYKLLEKLELLGIESDAYVNYNTTTYSLKGQSKYLEFMVDIFYNLFINFTVDNKYFEQERNAIVEEINSILNDGWIKLKEKVNSELFPNHVRELSQRFNIKNTYKIQPEDLITFHKKYYNTNNTLISISGDYNTKTLNKIISLFKNIKKTGRPNKFPIIKTIKNKQKHKNLFYIKNDNVMSTNIYLVFKINIGRFDNRRYIIFAILNILTNGLDSRLYKRLRGDSGLVYSIESDIDLGETSNTFSYISFSTQVLHKNVTKVIQIIMNQLNIIKNTKINPNEIKKFESDIEMGHLNSKLNKDPGIKLKQYSKYILWGQKPLNDLEKYKLNMNITADQILKMSKYIFDFNKIQIFYSGKKNYDKKITEIINVFV